MRTQKPKNNTFMTLKRLFSLVAIATFTLFAACETTGDETGGNKNDGPTSFTLEKTEFDFTAEGGNATVKYTITSPVQGGVVLTECKDSWIKDLSTATYGSIKFTVAPNYTAEARETTIYAIYTGLKGAHSITIRQEANTDPVFSYNVTHNAPRTLMLDVKPADKETAYICDIYSQAHLDAFSLNDDFLLYKYHLEALSYKAERSGQSLLNYLQNVSYCGDELDIEFTDLNPDTDYVVFCFHIDLLTTDIIGDIYREVIRTSTPKPVDVELGMTLTPHNNAILQTITSSDEEAYYYTGYWKVDEFYSYFGRDAKMEEVFPAKWNETVITQLSYGKSLAAIIEEFCQKGSKDIDNTGLANYTEYAFFLFAIDPETGFAASEPIIKTAETTSATDSGVTIEITVKNIMANTADVYWKASSKGATFERSVCTKSEYDSFGSNDDERYENIRKKYTLIQATGDTDMNLTGLTPNTTYVAYAYGVDGETRNTRIFTTEFTTLSNTPGKSNIKIEWTNHFNLAEVAGVDTEHWGDYAAYSNRALIPATISGVKSENGDEVYIMLSSYYSEYYGSDSSQWLRDLVSNENNKVNYYSNYNIIADYERDYTLVAVAKDADGNFGALYKRAVCLYASDSADVASYVYAENK